MSFDLGEFVFIEWLDAETVGDCNWMEISEALERAKESPPLIKTVGFVLHQTKEYIALVDSIGANETGHLTKIPKKMIKRKYSYETGAE